MASWYILRIALVFQLLQGIIQVLGQDTENLSCTIVIQGKAGSFKCTGDGVQVYEKTGYSAVGNNASIGAGLPDDGASQAPFFLEATAPLELDLEFTSNNNETLTLPDDIMSSTRFVLDIYSEHPITFKRIAAKDLNLVGGGLLNVISDSITVQRLTVESVTASRFDEDLTAPPRETEALIHFGAATTDNQQLQKLHNVQFSYVMLNSIPSLVSMMEYENIDIANVIMESIEVDGYASYRNESYAEDSLEHECELQVGRFRQGGLISIYRTGNTEDYMFEDCMDLIPPPFEPGDTINSPTITLHMLNFTGIYTDFFTSLVFLRNYYFVNATDVFVDNAQVQNVDGSGIFAVIDIKPEDKLAMDKTGNFAEYSGMLKQDPRLDSDITDQVGSYFLLENSNFTKIRSTQNIGHGGGLYIRNYELLHTTTVVFEGGIVIGHGGGVYAANVSYIEIEETDFFNCTAEGHGGGLLATDFNEMILNQTTFGGNQGDLNKASIGGALATYIPGQTLLSEVVGARLRMVDCRFTDNFARGEPISIHQIRDVELYRNTFIGNFQRDTSSAVVIKNAQRLRLFTSEFTDNTQMQGQGGALSVLDVDYVIIKETKFIGNQASNMVEEQFDQQFKWGTGNGGALFIAGAKVWVEIESCRFEKNIAQGSGGGLFMERVCSPLVTNCDFIDNEAQLNGGAVQMQLQAFSEVCYPDHVLYNLHAQKQLVFSDLQAEYIFSERRRGFEDLGQLKFPYSYPLLTDYGHIGLYLSRFEGNVARDSGGAVSFETRYSGEDLPLQSFENLYFNNNSAHNGAAIFIGPGFSGALVMQNITASYNKPVDILDENVSGEAGRGGVIYMAEPRVRSNALVIMESQFWGNVAMQGGVLYAERGSNVFFSSSIAYQNAAGDGGVIFCNACDILGGQLNSAPAMVLKDLEVEYKHNKIPQLAPQAPAELQTMFDELPEELSDISYSYMNSNVAVPYTKDSGRGGAVCCIDCGFVMLHATFMVGNRAGTGGAVYIGADREWYGPVVVMSDMVLVGNNATMNSPLSENGKFGGGAYITAAKLMVNGSSFSENYAQEGGALYWKVHGGRLLNRLRDPVGVLSTGAARDLRNVIQCPDILSTTYTSEQFLYQQFNSSYTEGPCSQKTTIPPIVCQANDFSPLTGLYQQVDYTDWDFYRAVRCSNWLDQALNAFRSDSLYNLTDKDALMTFNEVQLSHSDINYTGVNILGELIYIEQVDDVEPYVVICNEVEECREAAKPPQILDDCSKVSECVNDRLYSFMTAEAMVQSRHSIFDLSAYDSGKGAFEVASSLKPGEERALKPEDTVGPGLGSVDNATLLGPIITPEQADELDAIVAAFQQSAQQDYGAVSPADIDDLMQEGGVNSDGYDLTDEQMDGLNQEVEDAENAQGDGSTYLTDEEMAKLEYYAEEADQQEEATGNGFVNGDLTEFGVGNAEAYQAYLESVEFDDEGNSISTNDYMLSLVGNGVIRLSEGEYYAETVAPNGALSLEIKVTQGGENVDRIRVQLSSSEVQLIGNPVVESSSFDREDSVADFSSVRVIAAPGVHALQATLEEGSSNSLLIYLPVRNCTWGEIQDVTDELFQCVKCTGNTFSFDMQECQACPNGAECTLIDDVPSTLLIPEPGWWHAAADSSRMRRCIRGDACDYDERYEILGLCQALSWERLTLIHTVTKLIEDRKINQNLEEEDLLLPKLAESMHVLLNDDKQGYCQMFPPGLFGFEECITGQNDDGSNQLDATCIDGQCKFLEDECDECVIRNRNYPDKCNDACDVVERCRYVMEEFFITNAGVLEEGNKPQDYIGLQCNEGYTGALCAGCVRSLEVQDEKTRKYGLSEYMECQECQGKHGAFFLLSLVGTACVLLVTTIAVMASNRAGFKEHYISADVLKVAIFFVQQITILGSVVVNLPGFFETIISILSNLATPTVGVGCMYDRTSSVPQGTATAVVQLLAPILVLIVVALFYVVYMRISCCPGTASFQLRRKRFQNFEEVDVIPATQTPYQEPPPTVGAPATPEVTPPTALNSSSVEPTPKRGKRVGSLLPTTTAGKGLPGMGDLDNSSDDDSIALPMFPSSGPVGESVEDGPQRGSRIGKQKLLENGDSYGELLPTSMIQKESDISDKNGVNPLFATHSDLGDNDSRGMRNYTISNHMDLVMNPVFSEVHDMEVKRKQAVGQSLTGHKSQGGWRSEVQVLLLVAMTFFYPVIAGTILSIFSCVGIGESGESYWIRDMSMQCYEGKHLTLVLVMGIIGLVVFVAGPPLLMFSLLHHIRGSSLYSQSRPQSLLYLYHSYHHSAQYWEAVKLCYLLALVLARVLSWELEAAERIGLFQSIVMGYLLIVLGLRPHRYGFVIFLEVLSYIVVLGTSYVILFGTLNESGEFALGSSKFKSALAFCCSMMILYLLMLVFLTTKGFMGKKVKFFESSKWPFGYFHGRIATQQSGMALTGQQSGISMVAAGKNGNRLAK